MDEKTLTQNLENLLKGGMAHMSFADAVKDFPADKINLQAPNVDYTFWHLIEHIRITQKDILEFIINPDYKEIKWPDDYWPNTDTKASEKDWHKTVGQFGEDLQELIKIAKNPKTDLSTKIKWGDGQTIFRELLLVADHSSYHIGELGILRQVCKAW